MARAPLVDAHCHLVRRDLTDPGPAPLLGAMEGAGVSHAWCLGLPFDLERYHPPRYTAATDDAVLAAARASGGRLVPFVCGFDPRDPASLGYVERRLAEGFSGVGELLLRYDGDLGEVLSQPVDDPLLLAVYRLAGEARVPVMFHATVDFLDEIDRAVGACPETTFVWAHAGVSWEYRGDSSPLVRRLVERHPNLTADISWILWDYQLYDPLTRSLVPTWLDLFAAHPDRFLVGFDLVGEFDETGAMASRYHHILAHLPLEARDPIGRTNALRLAGDAEARGHGPIAT